MLSHHALNANAPPNNLRTKRFSACNCKCNHRKVGNKSTLGQTKILFRLYFVVWAPRMRSPLYAYCLPTRCEPLRVHVVALYVFRFCVLVLVAYLAQTETIPRFAFHIFPFPNIVILGFGVSVDVCRSSCVVDVSFGTTQPATELTIVAHKFPKNIRHTEPSTQTATHLKCDSF